jgi:hypothetical protein
MLYDLKFVLTMVGQQRHANAKRWLAQLVTPIAFQCSEVPLTDFPSGNGNRVHSRCGYHSQGYQA